MKDNYIFRWLSLLCLAIGFVTISLTAVAQQPVDIPERTEFGGISLRLEEPLRKQIKVYADKLTASPYYFRLIVERADAYFPIVEKVMREEGVPEDFKYLCIQESNLISDVVSSSQAVGFWQFKAASAMEVGLKINSDVDERMNISASSRGAAKYMKRNQQYLNNWVYTLLSYYAGLTGAKSVLKEEYLGKSEMVLDKDTHWYIVKFLAHKFVFENAVARNQVKPLVVLEYPECNGKTLGQIADETNVDEEEIAFYNKWLKIDRVPTDGNYIVLLPVHQEPTDGLVVKGVPGDHPGVKPYKPNPIITLFRKEEKYAEPVRNADGTITYTSDAPIFIFWNGVKAIQARKNDDISRLALQADLSRDDFLKYNDLRVFDKIVPDQIYYTKSKRRRARVPFHTVQQGETLWEISQNYGITIKSLMRKNRMNRPEKLKPGRVLWMRRTRPSNTPIEYKKVAIKEEKFIPLDKPQTEEPQQKDEPKLGNRDINPANIATTSNNSKGPQTGDVVLQKVPTMEEVDVASDNHSDNIEAIQPEQVDTGIKKADNQNYKTHKIQPGETISMVATLYKVPLDSIEKWNNLEEKPPVLGQSLRIYETKKDTKPVTPEVDFTEAMPDDPARKAAMPKLIGQEKNELPAHIDPESEAKEEEKEKRSNDNSSRKLNSIETAENSGKGNRVDRSVKATFDFEDGTFRTHKVKSGETLFAIARLYKVIPDSIIHWNKMENVNLWPGQILQVRKNLPKAPRSANTKTVEVNKEVESDKQNEQTIASRSHTVEAGQTLYGISRLYKVHTDSLLTWNSMASSADLKVGQTLTIKTEQPEAEKPAAGNTYTVQPGDTFYKIAREQGVSIQQLMQLNNKSEATLSVGEVLKLK